MLTASPKAKSPESSNRSWRYASTAAHSASVGRASVPGGPAGVGVGAAGVGRAVGAASPDCAGSGSVPWTPTVVVPSGVAAAVDAVVPVSSESCCSAGGPSSEPVVEGAAVGREALQPASAAVVTSATIRVTARRSCRTCMASIMVRGDAAEPSPHPDSTALATRSVPNAVRIARYSRPVAAITAE